MATSIRQLKEIADALVEVAFASKKLASVMRDTCIVQDAFNLDRTFASELSNASIPIVKRRHALEHALGKQIEPHLINALLLLQDQDLLDQLPNFFQTLKASAKERGGYRQATVTTTIELTPAQHEAILKQLTSKFGGTIELIERHDSSIVGGMTIDVDGWRYDAGIVGTCQRLKETLSTP